VEQAANQTREIEQSLANGQKQRQAEALRTEIEAKKQKMNNEMTAPDHGEQRQDPAMSRQRYGRSLPDIRKRLSP
jgi:ribosome-interacting GTPase 1